MANYISKFTGAEIDEILTNAKAPNHSVDALFVGLKQAGIFVVAEDVENNELMRQTGGTELAGLTVLDGSTATVNKITGKTVVDGGLEHAKISGIKSTGRNLFNPNRTVVENFGDASASTVRNFIPNSIIIGVSFVNDYYEDGVDDFSFKNGVLSFSTINPGYGVGFNFDCNGSEKYWFTFQKEGEHGTSVAFYKDGVFMLGHAFIDTFTTPEGCNQFVVKLETTVGGKATFYDLQLERNRETDYVPYTESVMNLFETIELGEWDSIENGKLIKRTEMLALTGEENWVPSGDYYTTSAIDSSAKDGQIVIAPGFEYGKVSTSTGGGKLVFTVNKELYPTIDDWKNYLRQQNSNDNPLTIAFELATPTITGIPANFKYQVWDKGQEIMQLESVDAIPTIIADYYVLGGTTK